MPPGGPPSAVFEALRECAPVVGGLIGVMGERLSGSSISHVVGLPGGVIEGWTSTPLPLLGRMLAPLLPATPGQLIGDGAITGALREQIALLQVMKRAGLGESAGYKVAVRLTASGAATHRFLTLALEGGATFRPSDGEIFRRLQPEIDAALSRMDVPLIASEPILSQIVEERELGYLCASPSGSVVELNARAQELAHAYAPAVRVEKGRAWLERFVQRLIAETGQQRTLEIPRPDGGATLSVSAHRLSRGVHAVTEPLTLVLLREETAALSLPAPLTRTLTRRQLDVAQQLATTGRSYKEIAEHLGISQGTIRKHVEQVYRTLGVRSRPELLARLRAFAG